MEGAKSIGVHLLSRAAAFAGDNFGLYLPKAAVNGRISVSQVKSRQSELSWRGISRTPLFVFAFFFIFFCVNTIVSVGACQEEATDDTTVAVH